MAEVYASVQAHGLTILMTEVHASFQAHGLTSLATQVHARLPWANPFNRSGLQIQLLAGDCGGLAGRFGL
jgi:hypothetical protein